MENKANKPCAKKVCPIFVIACGCIPVDNFDHRACIEESCAWYDVKFGKCAIPSMAVGVTKR